MPAHYAREELASMGEVGCLCYSEIAPREALVLPRYGVRAHVGEQPRPIGTSTRIAGQS